MTCDSITRDSDPAQVSVEVTDHGTRYRLRPIPFHRTTGFELDAASPGSMDLATQPQAFVVTTVVDHEREVALTLASCLTLTGMNQICVADITDIRLRAELVYLAVMLDAYSRKVVGWAMDRTLAARVGPPFRSRRSVCVRGVRDPAASTPHDAGDEPASQPL